ncbi:hypothetical protein ACMFMG_005872 [Clarireedia jacksonii]
MRQLRLGDPPTKVTVAVQTGRNHTSRTASDLREPNGGSTSNRNTYYQSAEYHRHGTGNSRWDSSNTNNYHRNNMFNSPPSLLHPLPQRNNLTSNWMSNMQATNAVNFSTYGAPNRQHGGYNYHHEGQHMNHSKTSGYSSPNADFRSSSIPVNYQPDFVPRWLDGIPDSQQISTSSSQIAALSSSPLEIVPGVEIASTSYPSWLMPPTQFQPIDQMRNDRSNPWASPAPSSTYVQGYHDDYMYAPYPYQGNSGGYADSTTQAMPTTPVIANGSLDPSVYPPIQEGPDLPVIDELQIEDGASKDDELEIEQYQPDYLGLTMCPSHPRQESPVARPQSCPPKFEDEAENLGLTMRTYSAPDSPVSMNV